MDRIRLEGELESQPLAVDPRFRVPGRKGAPMLRMDPSALSRAAEQLKRTTEEHAAWHENLLRSIFCDLPGDEDDMAPTAHRECSLGRWYYEEAPHRMRDQPAFIASGKEH